MKNIDGDDISNALDAIPHREVMNINGICLGGLCVNMNVLGDIRDSAINTVILSLKYCVDLLYHMCER